MKLISKFGFLLAISTLFTIGCSDDPAAPEVPGVELPDVTKTIQDLRNLVTGDDAYEIPAGFVFKGTVVSNQGESNNFYRALYLQSGDVAIKLSCDKGGSEYYETLTPGQVVHVTADGMYVAKYYDTYTMGYAASGDKYKVSPIGADKLEIIVAESETIEPITPKEINDFSALSFEMVGTLVKVNNVQVVEGDRNKKIGGDGSQGYTSITFTKADGETIQISNNNFATFGEQTVPDGSGSITGILNTYGADFQIANTKIEDLDLTGDRFEVENGSGGDVCEGMDTPVGSLFETFSSVVDYTDFEIEGWLNIFDEGERKWQGKVYDSNGYIQASAHNASDGTHTMWAITPPLDVDNAGSKIAKFKSAMAYWKESTTIEVFAIQCDNGTATETKLNPTLPTAASTEHEFIASGDIDLSSFSGVVRIGFKYSGQGGSSNSTTWRIDDVEFNNTTTSVEFTSTPVITVGSEEAYNYNVSTSITNGSGATSISASGLPSWATLTDNGDGTAVISGTAPAVTENENSSVTLTATNNGVSVNQEYTLTVKAPVAPGSNLLVNGGFENWTDDSTPASWTKAESLTKESTTIKEGSFSAKQVGGTKDIAQTIDVTAGKTYEVTIWYNVASGDGEDARLWCHYINDAGSNDYDNTPVEIRDGNSYLSSGNNNEWLSYTAQFTVPAGIAKLNFEVRTYSGATVYWDNLSVVEKQ